MDSVSKDGRTECFSPGEEDRRDDSGSALIFEDDGMEE
jgi:hypothetical protein